MCHVTYGHYFTLQNVKMITPNIPHKLDISPIDSKYPLIAYIILELKFKYPLIAYIILGLKKVQNISKPDNSTDRKEA